MAAGCGRGGGRPATVRVSGVVTLNGRPVPETRIRFTPESEQSGRTAIGDTDASGKFTLSTFEPGDGIVPGIYDVDLTSNAVPQAAVDTTDLTAKLAATEAATESIPEKYRDRKTSGLHYTFTEQDEGRMIEVNLTR